jgi:hypothetical protein
MAPLLATAMARYTRFQQARGVDHFLLDLQPLKADVRGFVWRGQSREELSRFCWTK